MMRYRRVGRYSRREILKGMGRGLGGFALVAASGPLAGCSGSSPNPMASDPDGQELFTEPILPDPATINPVTNPELFNALEMVGGVTSDEATIRLVAGEQAHAARFQMLYDTAPHTNPGDYVYRSGEIVGPNLHDPINFHLEGLSPDTRHYYRVRYDTGGGWGYRDEYAFRTRRPAGSGFRFCLTGDFHIFPYGVPMQNTHIRRTVCQNVLADAPDILLTLGDDAFPAYQGRVPYPLSVSSVLWNTFRHTREFLDHAGHAMQVVPVLGNHEGLFGWTRDTWQYAEIRQARANYLPLPDATTHPEGGDPDGRFGAFTWGDVLFVWLDVLGDCPEDPMLTKNSGDYVMGDAQRSFFERTLAGSRAKWKFVFAHHLFGGDDVWWAGYGRGNANDAGSNQQAEIQSLMERHGVQAFFYGHDHMFSVSRANGVAYICTGQAGSGCPWIENGVKYYAPCDILVTDQDGRSPPGHVRVDVDPAGNRVTISYIKASDSLDNGTVLSRFTLPA